MTDARRAPLRAQPRRLLSSRRGMFFLFIALLLVAILLTIMYARTVPTSHDRAESILTRINGMSDFLRDFDNDVHRATFISGFRAFIALEQRISERGAFLDDPGPSFVEAFMNGSINGTSYAVLDDSTFSEYLLRVNHEANRVGIVLNASVSNITLAQSSPWTIAVTFLLSINVSDTRSLARWDYERNFTTDVSILDLRDPVYSVYTFGRLPNTVRMSPYNNSQFYNAATNNATALNNEALNMYYREDPHAPSFLQRLHGNLTATSKYGIASIVNLDELNAQGIAVNTTRAVIDSVYFSGASTTNWCPNASLGTPKPSWLRIDGAHYNDSRHDYEFPQMNATVC
jgi:hypothetical protein